MAALYEQLAGGKPCSVDAIMPCTKWYMIYVAGMHEKQSSHSFYNIMSSCCWPAGIPEEAQLGGRGLRGRGNSLGEEEEGR